jgi:hypothetical protein
MLPKMQTKRPRAAAHARRSNDVANKRDSDFTESDRQRLQEIAQEREHLDWLKARRKARMESIRGWITWITAAWVLKDLLWSAAAGFIRDHLK